MKTQNQGSYYLVTSTTGKTTEIFAMTIQIACKMAIATFGKNIGMRVHNYTTNKTIKYLGN